MSANFDLFRTAVAKRFAEMQQHGLWETVLAPDDVYAAYQAAFPKGSNEIYRERPQHDCATCRHFIRNIGNVVSFIDGKIVTIWDVLDQLPYEEMVYRQVTSAMGKLVRAAKIKQPFLTFMKTVGQDKTFEQMLGEDKKPNGQIHTWTHFFANIDAKFVMPEEKIGTELNERRNLHGLFLRGLREITMDALETVSDLIAQDSIYRGAEKKHIIEGFIEEKNVFLHVPVQDQENYVWQRVTKVPQAIAHTKNDVIGGLLEELVKGTDLEDAVKMYEARVAPTNYKRTSAVVTPAMIEKAKVAITELGLLSALDRRYATLSDITVNNVLWADRDAKKQMGASIFDDMIGEKKAAAVPKQLDKIEEIGIEEFLKNVLPKATSLEVMLENKHQPNLVSLITAADPTAGYLFSWDNNFSWSYNGELADSDLRQAVKERGGSVDGVFRFTHSWNHPGKRNTSLMDLHVFFPGNTIKAGNPTNDLYGTNARVGWNLRQHPGTGGIQDVDYTGQAPADYIPVENITFPDLSRMPRGTYVCKIHNWERRSDAIGFRAEIEFEGQVFQYEYDKAIGHKEWVTVAEVTLEGHSFSIKHHLQPTSAISKEVWGMKTLTWQRVTSVMHSPNFWDDQGIGNKHTFFMLQDARSGQPARGFYNEFLRKELHGDRKVFETVASKMKAQDTPDQLSGLGFSSTQRNEVVVRVQGSFTRMLKVQF